MSRILFDAFETDAGPSPVAAIVGATIGDEWTAAASLESTLTIAATVAAAIGNEWTAAASVSVVAPVGPVFVPPDAMSDRVARVTHSN